VINLEDYLKNEIAAGNIDFTIRAHHYNGQVTFYIHPGRTSGQTLNFDVHGNSLVTTAVSGETSKPLGQDKLPSL
jgi:hypothetical protein